jgi:lipoyl(octanoyl) transferase
MRRLHVVEYGRLSYEDGVELQRRLVERRKAGEIDDTLVLLEHPHVVTLGVKVRNSRAHVLRSDIELAQAGVGLFESGRGGDVTYHGPGQLVGYPIIDLKPDRTDAHRYVRDLEEVLIRVCSGYGLEATREPGLTGVWVGGEKVAAIGVRLSRWVTSHGFALNVDPDLSYFGLIVPCGITDRGVTSLARLLGTAPDPADVRRRVVSAFCEVFERVLVPVPDAPQPA